MLHLKKINNLALAQCCKCWLRWPNVGVMLIYRQQRRPIIKPTLGQSFVLARRVTHYKANSAKQSEKCQFWRIYSFYMIDVYKIGPSKFSFVKKRSANSNEHLIRQGFNQNIFNVYIENNASKFKMQLVLFLLLSLTCVSEVAQYNTHV